MSNGGLYIWGKKKDTDAYILYGFGILVIALVATAKESCAIRNTLTRRGGGGAML